MFQIAWYVNGFHCVKGNYTNCELELLFNVFAVEISLISFFLEISSQVRYFISFLTDFCDFLRKSFNFMKNKFIRCPKMWIIESVIFCEFFLFLCDFKKSIIFFKVFGKKITQGWEREFSIFWSIFVWKNPNN